MGNTLGACAGVRQHNNGPAPQQGQAPLMQPPQQPPQPQPQPPAGPGPFAQGGANLQQHPVAGVGPQAPQAGDPPPPPSYEETMAQQPPPPYSPPVELQSLQGGPGAPLPHGAVGGPRLGDVVLGEVPSGKKGGASWNPEEYGTQPAFAPSLSSVTVSGYAPGVLPTAPPTLSEVRVAGVEPSTSHASGAVGGPVGFLPWQELYGFTQSVGRAGGDIAVLFTDTKTEFSSSALNKEFFGNGAGKMINFLPNDLTYQSAMRFAGQDLVGLVMDVDGVSFEDRMKILVQALEIQRSGPGGANKMGEFVAQERQRLKEYDDGLEVG